jgi:4-deoxy-L-threo-5-hexosulose-uronate ketol-isomerase
MLNVQTRHAVHPAHAKTFDTEQLRAHFMAEDLFVSGKINLIYTHYDRYVMGGAVPDGGTLVLDYVDETKTPSFLDRREMGIVNIGDTGTVSCDGVTYPLGKGDVLYLGMGSGAVRFSGQGRYYIASAPAHYAYPSRLISLDQAAKVNLGAAVTSNERTINQFIHPTVMPSCQLILGYTNFAAGSVWNTIPAHIHDRRMEAYLYFDLSDDQRVVHLMGEPQETRNLIVANEQGVISPPWSIHCGAGTGSYTFIWAMAGDNIDYKDMDMIQPQDLR